MRGFGIMNNAKGTLTQWVFLFCYVQYLLSAIRAKLMHDP